MKKSIFTLFLFLLLTNLSFSQVEILLGEEYTVTSDGTGIWVLDECDYSTFGEENFFLFTPIYDGMYSLEMISSYLYEDDELENYIDYFYKDASLINDEFNWNCIGDLGTVGTDFETEHSDFGPLEAGVTYRILADAELSDFHQEQTFRIIPLYTQCGDINQIQSDEEGIWDLSSVCEYTTEGEFSVFTFTPEYNGNYQVIITGGLADHYVDYMIKQAVYPFTDQNWECIGDSDGLNDGLEIQDVIGGVEYNILAVVEDSDQELSQEFEIKCGECLPPVVDIATEPNQVTFSWEAVDGADDYIYAILSSGGNPLIGDITSDLEVVLTEDLECGAEFYFAIQSNCDSEFVKFATYPFVFSCDEECPIPTNVDIDYLSSTTVDVSFELMPDVAYDWYLVYENNGEPVTFDSGIDIIESPIHLEGLEPGTNYYFGIRTTCGEENFSEWVEMDVTTTVGLSKLEQKFGNIKLYPMPVHEKLNIEFDKLTKVESLVVRDSKGKQVDKFTDTNSQKVSQISVADYSPGVYFVSILTEQGVVNAKFIKE